MSKFFYKDKPIIGLDISSTGIKIMSADPKKWLVDGYGSIDLDPIKIKEAFENENNGKKKTSVISRVTALLLPYRPLEATREHLAFLRLPRMHSMKR
jgi:hypothetical protein